MTQIYPLASGHKHKSGQNVPTLPEEFTETTEEYIAAVATGEKRRPRKGEWFLSFNGHVRKTYAHQSERNHLSGLAYSIARVVKVKCEITVSVVEIQEL